jgi:hypothetical protein
MKTVNHENYTGHCRHAYSVARGCIAVLSRRGLSLLVAAAVWTGMACGTSYAQNCHRQPWSWFSTLDGGKRQQQWRAFLGRCDQWPQ